MKKLIDFVKKMVSSHSGISSKRVCGSIGFIVSIALLIYCTIAGVQAPNVFETFLYVCAALLGVDSITGIWKKFDATDKNKE